VRQGHVSPEARVGATAIAATAAAVAILEILQRSVDAFDPRPAISVLIVVSVFFATLALTVLRQRVARDSELRGAVRSWPLPRMARTDPYRLGIFPERGGGGGAGAAPYIPRGQVDEDLEESLRTSPRGFVLLSGPFRAGKSRTAFEATRRAIPDALVVAPHDGEALQAVLDLDPPLFSRRSRLPKWPRTSRAVLWLDGLDRFLEEIDPNVLEDLLTTPIPVTIVATIREDDYEAALAGSGAEAEGAKAVAAAAREFRIADDGTAARAARRGAASQEPTAGGSGARELHSPTRDPFFVGPAAVSIASLAAVLIVALAEGFSEPAPLSLAEQADEKLREAGGELVWGPARADLHGAGQESYLFAFEPEARGEPGASSSPSHEIRIYDQRGDQLVERFRFGPDVDGAQFQFRDLTDIGGGGAKLIGGYGFPDEASLALLPFVVRWDSTAGEYSIEALQDEPPELSESLNPKPEARPYLEAYRERITLRDRDSGRSISGHRVQDFAVEHDPDRLVSALAVDPRTASKPGVVEVRGNILNVSGPDPTLTACRFRSEPPPLLGSWSPGRLLQFEVLDPWKPFIKNRVCEPPL
jgi:hypothetical protein